MPQTLTADPGRVHHRIPSTVEIEQLADRVVAAAIGARKQRRAPKDKSIHQLRRDVACKKNRCYYTILRLMFEDLRAGERLDDVLGPLWMAIHAVESYSDPNPEAAFESYLKIEADLKAQEQQLELDMLLGNGSTSTVQLLEQTLHRHELLIEKERTALHRRLFLGEKINAA